MNAGRPLPLQRGAARRGAFHPLAARSNPRGLRAVDCFSGWGGFSEGARQAGVDVVWAANHWRLAVDAHAKNHPDTKHVCQDLRQADWTQLPEYDLLLAAPACQGHSQAAQPSRARSDRTRRYHDSLRPTAWAVVHCAEVTRPRAIIVENVPDFLRWSAPGGSMYEVWRLALERLGYTVVEHVLPATAFGVPQKRDRVFVTASLDGAIHLDAPTRFDEPAFGPCIDWDDGGDGGWRPFSASRGERARERLKIASRRFGRAIVQHVSHHKGLPLSEPIRTITTKDQWAVVNGRLYRPLTVRETARAMGFPDTYGWPEHATRSDAIKGLGNAVCPPVAREIITQVCDAMQGVRDVREAA